MKDMLKYVQYGCGFSFHENWRNFDASPTLRFERIPFIGRLYSKNTRRFPKNVEFGDIVRGLPFPKGSCQGCYCSHVLEHLSLTDFRIALRNTYQLLQAGAFFRLVMPDLEENIRRYQENTHPDAAINFISGLGICSESRTRGIRAILFDVFGNSLHRWLWDYKSLEKELLEAGFVNVRRAYFHDSSDQKFCEVEEEDRWQNCLGAECIRPN